MSFSQKKTLPIVRNRRCKKKKKKRRADSYRYRMHWLYPTVLVAFIVIFLTIYLCQCANQIGIQYEIGELGAKKKALLKAQREYKLEIEKLEELDRVERIATQELNMVYPSRRVVLDLNRPTSTALSEDFRTASR